MRFTVSYQQK